MNDMIKIRAYAMATVIVGTLMTVVLLMPAFARLAEIG